MGGRKKPARSVRNRNLLHAFLSILNLLYRFNITNRPAAYLNAEIPHVKDTLFALIDESDLVALRGQNDGAEIAEVFFERTCLSKKIFCEKGSAIYTDERAFKECKRKRRLGGFASSSHGAGDELAAPPFTDGGMP